MRLPEAVSTPRLTLRRWGPADASALSTAVESSLDHLRPWMSWAADEPLSAEARLDLIRAFEADWESGGDVVYGAFLGDAVIGGSGFNRRGGPDTLEIGYWVHVDHVRQGFATEMASSLTDAAFMIDGVERVEIHHDRANGRSRAVPKRLGFTFAGEHPDAVVAPAEEGIDCRWVMLRPAWVKRRDQRR
ncbi:MAG TPA: GNAT family protein [Acidimicrobiales bacterium]|jgi:RimJ/RimL family protein N-acetyltransferase|nr:GNAT family protein [Acidimicrobiales bacterium]